MLVFAENKLLYRWVNTPALSEGHPRALFHPSRPFVTPSHPSGGAAPSHHTLHQPTFTPLPSQPNHSAMTKIDDASVLLSVKLPEMSKGISTPSSEGRGERVRHQQHFNLSRLSHRTEIYKLLNGLLRRCCPKQRISKDLYWWSLVLVSWTSRKAQDRGGDRESINL